MWILDHEIPGKYTNLRAHSSLAIASISSKNELLISSGISIIDKIPISKSITSDEWHQENKHLLLAWDDASISVYDANDKSMVDGKLHSSPVTIMEWLSEGSKFVTVDTDNHVAVWKYDARKRLSVLVEYRMSHLIAKILIISGSSKDPMTFYMVCNDGIVYYADDSGHCQQLSQMFPNNIREIYHIPAKSLILAITRDFVIAKMSIENDGKLRQNQVIKLGLRSNSDFLTALIHDDALLISSPEQPLRVYNFSSDDSSILTIPLKMEDSEIITSLDWKKEYCLLLATTSKGLINIWKISDTQRPWQVKLLILLTDSCFKRSQEKMQTVLRIGVEMMTYLSKGMMRCRFILHGFASMPYTGTFMPFKHRELKS
jgi:WD40 repeat protein